MKHFFALLLLLIPVEALAAKRVWITEFVAPRVQAAAPFATLPSIAKQMIDLAAGVQSSAPFNVQTRYIRVICEVQCALTGSGTATVSDILLPPNFPEYFGVTAGKTISVIAAP